MPVSEGGSAESQVQAMLDLETKEYAVDEIF